MVLPPTTDWHAFAPADVASRVGVDIGTGLHGKEAAARLQRHGRNELEVQRTTPWWRVLGRQFVDVLILVLFAAAGISWGIGHTADAITILAIVVVNGLLGFTQEWRAERALAALQRMLAPRANVLRDGRMQIIDAATLVPGDVVAVAVGDRVPADVRLVDVLGLRADEASLTGESDSVAKAVEAVEPDALLPERRSMAWMGTTISNGRAKGVVVETGMSTEFGRIADMTQSVGRELTPLQRKLGTLGRRLGLLALGVSVLVAVVGLLAGREALDMFFTAVSLAVAFVPEGLPAVVTITLALGVRAMVKRKALLRRLPAAEALGAATVICTDKTGTLTRSEMTVQRIWTRANTFEATGVGYDPAGHLERAGARIKAVDYPDLVALLETGLRCNHAAVVQGDDGWNLVGEPTEGALVVAAYKAWLPEPEGEQELVEFSFDSTRKRMTVLMQGVAGCIAHVKGAPEVVLERASHVMEGSGSRPMTDEDRTDAEAVYEAMAAHGLRTLALARREVPGECTLDAEEVERDLTLLGIVAMIDPPRPEVRSAVALAQGAGIRTIMITGDAPATALAVGRKVGLEAERALTGHDLETMDDDALLAALSDRIVFARTTPAHKLRIVNLLQARGAIVAMTGDGVNDAPALKKADIGIAMGIRGTDVAQGASDMILMDDNYASIVNAVEEGRREFGNIRKFVRYLLSSNTGEVIAIFVNILMGGPLILLPVQILWINLVTDSITALALGAEPAGKDIMRRPPRDPAAPILSRGGVAFVLTMGAWIGGVTLLLYYVYRDAGERGAVVAQTVAFTSLIVTEKFNVLNCRSPRAPIRVIGFFSNPWLLLAVGASIGLQVCAVYVPFLQEALYTVPLAAIDWLWIVLAAAPAFLVPEVVKHMRWRNG